MASARPSVSSGNRPPPIGPVPPAPPRASVSHQATSSSHPPRAAAGSVSGAGGRGGKAPVIKIVVVGKFAVGKTALITRFRDPHYLFGRAYKATIGTELITKEVVVDGETFQLQIWDTAGQERFNALTDMFYRGSDAVILVFDVTDPNSFEVLPRWKDEFYMAVGMDDQVPCGILANKADITGPARRVSNKRATTWVKFVESCGGHPVQYFETSAKDSINVDVAFLAIARQAIDRHRRLRANQVEATAQKNTAAPGSSASSSSSTSPAVVSLTDGDARQPRRKGGSGPTCCS